MVVLVVVGVLASIFLIRGGVPWAPLQAELPTQPPESASPAIVATPTAVARVPDLSQGTARLTVEPSESLRFVSPDGGVTIEIEAGSVEETLSLTFTRLSDLQIPALPDGISGTERAFDLSVFSPEGFSFSEYSFLQPIIVAVELPASLIDAARVSPVLVSLEHYEPGEGWVALSAVYDKDSEILTASVSSLSIFALLLQESGDTSQGPIQGFEPTSTATSEPTSVASSTATSSPTPSATPTIVPTLTLTPEPTLTPTSTSTPIPAPTATPSATPTPTATLMPIPVPVLLEPADGANLRDTTPTFLWSPVEGTSSMFYELQIDDRIDFGTTIVLINIGSETSYTITADRRLEVDIYYWRVRAIDGGRLGPFSEIQTLKVRRK